jgi:two-component system OmpR family sensor kinase
MSGWLGRSPLPGRLFWRVYLNGLLLLLLVAIAVASVGAALRHVPAGGGHNPERFAAYAAERVAELRRDPAALEGELRRVRETFGAEVTVYGAGGVLATNVEPPLPPLDERDRSQLSAHAALRRGHHGAFRVRGRHFTFAAPVPGEPGAYVLLSGSFPLPSLLRATSLIMAILLALALASIPLARAIASPLERLGRAVRAFGAGDLTARARLRARGEVAEVAGAFDQMADRIEALLRGERELLANVSHELRTPLARIRVALDLAAEGDHERARRYLAEIGADLGELERLLEDVLTAARLDLSAGREGGSLPLRKERLDARALVTLAAERFRGDHPGRALEVSVEGELPPIDADPALLRRALENLLDNARKYSDAGEAIALSARADQRGVSVEVRDRGIGLDPADLEKIFTPFFRSDRSRARGTGGVGLGLALTKRVVEAHGGSISVESEPGRGTAMRFTVPAAAGAAPRES